MLVSTDKAVRPTSIMGASKRLAEMVLQARAADGRGRTVFTMVRFGNVLDSSGSVVRRFRRQIEAGGPVTVTHPEVIRYFMSIPEAAALVIQAGAMATGGDVFVLDMGEPVKIDDLARSMIRLMGLRGARRQASRRRHRHRVHRPAPRREAARGAAAGRKHRPDRASAHPQEPRAVDAVARELAAVLDELREASTTEDVEAIQAVLMRAVEGYRPESARSCVHRGVRRIEARTVDTAVASLSRRANTGKAAPHSVPGRRPIAGAIRRRCGLTLLAPRPLLRFFAGAGAVLGLGFFRRRQADRHAAEDQ